MGSQALPLVNKGIFHSLPTFSPDIKDQTAIVTGANGISGFHMLRVLLESPQRWTKIWAASRRPPPDDMMAMLSAEQRARVEHVAVDFLGDVQGIAEQLSSKGVSADCIFFYSYAQPPPAKGEAIWSNAQELTDTNAALLRNFVQALDIAKIIPKRFLLQTGAKNYGVHNGPFRSPCTESDPRVTLETNFYYAQEDILFDYCKSHPSTAWNVIMPAWVIGAVNNAAMNALHPLAVYAAVQAHKKQKLDFPGDIDAWLGLSEHSTAMLTGYLSEWVALEQKCANQKFNASDTCPLPNNRLWPELARWYGAPGFTIPELDDSKITTVSPAKDVATPLGYGPGRTMRFTWTLSDWAAKPENQQAWKDIMAEHDLSDNPFDDIPAHFAFGDAAAFGLAMILSMNKARSFGWTGHVDTLESLHLSFSEMSKLRMLPPPVAKANPLI